MFNSLLNPKALGEISKDLGQIFFASVFLVGFFGETVSYSSTITGLVFSIVFWSGYIISSKN